MEQNGDEFEWMVSTQSYHARSILEIGSRDGATLKGLAATAWPGARINSIDIGVCFTDGLLQATIVNLCYQGFDAELFVGDSHTSEALTWAKQRAPYDFIFIDGDHSYAGVKQDWEWYGPLGKSVAFHDINNDVDGNVMQLWAEIKAAGHKTLERICGEICGIGIVFQ